MTLNKKPKISTKEVMTFIKKKDVVTYLQLVAEFCPDNKDQELWNFVAHNIRQKIYLQNSSGRIKWISRGKYKYNYK